MCVCVGHHVQIVSSFVRSGKESPAQLEAPATAAPERACVSVRRASCANVGGMGVAIFAAPPSLLSLTGLPSLTGLSRRLRLMARLVMCRTLFPPSLRRRTTRYHLGDKLGCAEKRGQIKRWEQFFKIGATRGGEIRKYYLGHPTLCEQFSKFH